MSGEWKAPDYLPTEEGKEVLPYEGPAWAVFVGTPDGPALVGPFWAYTDVLDWLRIVLDQGIEDYAVTTLIRPEDYPGAVVPPEDDDDDEETTYLPFPE